MPVIVIVCVAVIEWVIMVMMMVAVGMRMRVVMKHGPGSARPSPLWGGVGEGSLRVKDLVRHPSPRPSPHKGERAVRSRGPHLRVIP
jgi:hypothetical protein